MAWNMSYYFCSAPDHDMYVTHKEKESNKKLDEIDWGELQVRHSANFMNKYDIFTRFYGGINYQIEHHLFPALCSYHLPEISKIVKETCDEFNIKYISNPSIIGAYWSAINNLYQINNPKKLD